MCAAFELVAMWGEKMVESSMEMANNSSDTPSIEANEDFSYPSGAKEEGLPWTVAKGQDTFTPISSILSFSRVPDPHSLELWLKVDGEIRQKGSTEDMIFKIPFLISHISSIMTLLEGDVIHTGTPKGVGPVKVSQKIEVGITGILDVHFDVGRRQNI
ncbi:unnamed protein product [Lactuca virosa]|uniref:Fumarylacetoacetase-like C-terminal domain-containing protein n=1 Tax=Lactuca virosa TaxID=75947 RepID=A0AAU9NXY2_9ASTR|nr:unnamed protein product [Lactuca virosa]